MSFDGGALCSWPDVRIEPIAEPVFLVGLAGAFSLWHGLLRRTCGHAGRLKERRESFFAAEPAKVQVKPKPL